MNWDWITFPIYIVTSLVMIAFALYWVWQPLRGLYRVLADLVEIAWLLIWRTIRGRGR